MRNHEKVLASLFPGEIATLGTAFGVFAIKGVGERAVYRWLTRDYRDVAALARAHALVSFAQDPSGLDRSFFGPAELVGRGRYVQARDCCASTNACVVIHVRLWSRRLAARRRDDLLSTPRSRSAVNSAREVSLGKLCVPNDRKQGTAGQHWPHAEARRKMLAAARLRLAHGPFGH